MSSQKHSKSGKAPQSEFARLLRDGTVGSFTAWLFSAERLKTAANLVLAGISEDERRPSVSDALDGAPEGFVRVTATPDLRGVYLYLAFLAIENLLKGILVRGSRAAEMHHRILDLVADANVTLDDGERAFVGLARSVDSLGRFAGPKDPTVDNIVLPDGLDLNGMAAVFDGLYDKLVDVLMAGVDDGRFG